MRNRINLLNALSKRLNSSHEPAKTFLPFEAIPGPRPLPLIGNVWRYLPLVGDYDINKLFENAKINKTKYGPIVREQITRDHVILHLFDPNDIESFFRQDSNKPYRRSHRALLKLRHDNPECYNDGGIFPENGQSWSRLRGLFHQSLMKKEIVVKRAIMLDDITRGTINLISVEQQSNSPQGAIKLNKFDQFLYRWSVRCGLATFLDYSTSTMPDDIVVDQIIDCSSDQLEALAGTEIKSERWAKQPSKCPYYQQLSRQEEFMYKFVKERVDYLIGTKSTGDNSYVHDWLINDKLDLKDVITFLVDCITANVHTNVYTSMFLLENISKRMEINLKDHLMREISSVSAIDDHHLDDRIMGDIGETMPTLRDSLKETLRLHPVSIGTGRLTQFDMSIRNYHIPKDVMVIAHNQTISRDPNIYEDPDEFKPDRWAYYKSKSRLERPSSFAWLPFGFGPRACIGQRFVSLEIYILAIRLLQKFDIAFLDDVIKTKTTIVHQLDGPIAVELTPILNKSAMNEYPLTGGYQCRLLGS
uniref:Cytochrome P450 302a1, mitochondrial n=1 Tax=Aceria tosichella TaxID=561515 RepID=A0A6G1SHK3_9ACAR